MNRPLHNYKWSVKKIKLIYEHWDSLPTPEIAKLIGYPSWIVSGKARQLGLPTNKRKTWTKQQEDYLIANYKTLSNVELTNNLNKLWPKKSPKFTIAKIQGAIFKLSLKRTPEELRIIKSHNVDNGSYDLNGGHNEQKIGTISVRNSISTKAGKVRMPGKVIKTADGWILHKHYVWEQENGPIPKGYQIECMDGNELNTDLKNLRMRKRIESANLVFAGKILTDKYVAGLLIRNDKQARESLIKEGKAILEMKRTQIELNRTINGKAR